MGNVSIEKHVLNWAIERAGYTPFDLEKKFPKIQQWIKGERQPTLRQLESFAKTTRIPLGYLFLKEPPEEELPVPFYRTPTNGQETIDDISPELRDTIYAMQRRQLWMREYLIDLGVEPLSFIHSAKLEDDPALVAKFIRNTLKLSEDWASELSTWEDALRLLRNTIEENIGVIVVFNGIVGNNTKRKLNPSEFRGFVLVDEYAPLLFVNNADVKAAKMFTLAHELAHIYLGKSAAFDLRKMLPANNKIELFCNHVAAEFLVPKSKMLIAWPKAKNTSEPFHTLAREFKVSVLVAARRALDLKLINKSSFLEFYSQYQQYERLAKSDTSGGDFYKNQNLRIGLRFFSAVTQATKEGKISYLEAYQLTGLYGKTFDNFVASLEQGGL